MIPKISAYGFYFPVLDVTQSFHTSPEKDSSISVIPVGVIYSPESVCQISLRKLSQHLVIETDRPK